MNDNQPQMTPEQHTAMAEVAWYFWPREEGVRKPGSFHHALIQALAQADERNYRRLYEAFPEYAWPFRLAVSEADARQHILEAINGK